MGYKSKYKGSEIENLLDKAKNDYTVKEYTDYAGYNADTSRPSNTISFIEQDNSIWIQDRQYSQNAGCYVGSDKAGIPTTAWYLAGTLSVAIIGWDVQYLGYCTNSLLSEGGGLFVLNLRFNSATDIQIKKFAWLAKTGSTPNLRLVVSEGKVQLYVFVAGGQYRGANIRILTESTSANRASTAGARNFFKLTDNITPETTEPVGTDIADAPYLLKTAAAAGSQKVLQTNTSSSAERRVLLGENHETTQQDKVYKSPDLTYNPNSKTLTVPTIKNPNGSWVHTAEGVAGQSGYVKVATIKINTVYTDLPLTIQFTGRNHLQPAKIYIRFYSENNTDPTLASFYYESGSTRFGEYLHKSATGTWDLYVKKSQGWDKIIILSCENPYAFLSPNPNYSITWQDELVTTLPTDYVESVMSTKRIHVSGNANSANKLVAPRKIGFASFDGTADLSLNVIQGAFSVRWTTNTTQWQRIVRLKTNKTYTRRQLIMGVYDTENGHFSGTIKVTLIVSNKLTSGGPFATVNWLSLWEYPQYRGHQGAFKVVVIYPTDSDENVYLDVYANTPYTYENYTFTVLSCNDASGLTIGNSGEWVEGSALQNVIATSTTDTSLISNQSLSATDSAFLQSLEGLCHKSNDSSLKLQRRTEYICGQQVLSDTEEAGKAFYGSSANPLVISVPLKDPGDAVAGGKVNVNLIRYYYAENYWQELFFVVNSPNIYTRWVAIGNARPWYRMMKEDSTIEYNAWVTKATNATNVCRCLGS